MIYIFFFDNSGIWAATFPTIPPKGVQRPNGRDVKSVVAKTRTRVAGSTAVPPLPPSYERLVKRIKFGPLLGKKAFSWNVGCLSNYKNGNFISYVLAAYTI